MAGKTGRPNRHSETTWQSARDAIAAGASFPDTSKATGIPEHAMRKRSEREKWLNPHVALRKARKTIATLSAAQAAREYEIAHKQAAESGVTSTGGGNVLSKMVESTDPEGRKRREISDPRDLANEKTAVLVLQTLAKNEEKANLMASNIATGLIERAATSKKHKLAPLEDIQDLSKALGVVRTANGSDDKDGKVTVNLFAGPSSSAGVEGARQFRRRVIDVDAQAVPSEV